MCAAARLCQFLESGKKSCVNPHYPPTDPSQSYGASLAIWDHTVLPATRDKWTCPALTPARQAGTLFTYPIGMEGWVNLGSLIAAWPEIEPTTAWSQVRRPNRYATKPGRLSVAVLILSYSILFPSCQESWQFPWRGLLCRLFFFKQWQDCWRPVLCGVFVTVTFSVFQVRQSLVFIVRRGSRWHRCMHSSGASDKLLLSYLYHLLGYWRRYECRVRIVTVVVSVTVSRPRMMLLEIT